MLIKFHCPHCGAKIEGDAALRGGRAQCPGCDMTIMVPVPEIEPGTMLGGFRIERHLGSGSMGDVYLATQLSLHRQVALKILPPAVTRDEQTVDRFLHEVRMLAKIQHANVVTAIEAGEDSGIYYLAMTYVAGENLADRLKRAGELPEREALTIAMKVAGALQHVWDRHQIIHRDIKPANIMMDVTGQVMLMDMGISKSFAGEDKSVTTSGFTIGTPDYMSPEQAMARTDLDFRSDLYSLGTTLYHLAVGVSPYKSERIIDVMSKHINDPFPPPQDRNPAVSDGCAALLEKMMSKAREDRHQNWGALIEDIRRVLGGGMPAGMHREGGGVVLDAVEVQQARELAAPPARSGELVQLLVVFAVATLVLGGGWWLWRNVLSARSSAPDTVVVPPPPPPLDPSDWPDVPPDSGTDILVQGGGPDGGGVGDKEPPPAGHGATGAKSLAQRMAGLRDELGRLNREAVPLRFQYSTKAGNAVWLDVGSNPALADISPLAACSDMRLVVLDLNGTAVRDLSPLRGVALTDLVLDDTPVSDISALRGMPLQRLSLNGTAVADLRVLAGLPLRLLRIAGTPVADVSVLRGSGLRELHIDGCGEVTDWSALAGCRELQKLSLSPDQRGIAELRALSHVTSLRQDGQWVPAAAFWDAVGDGVGDVPEPGTGATVSEEAYLRDVMRRVASALLALEPARAMTELKEGVASPTHSASHGALREALMHVERMATIDERIMRSLVADVGKSVPLQFRAGKQTLEIKAVSGKTVKAMAVVVRDGKVVGHLGRTFTYADLDVREKLRRLGDDDTPGIEFMRGYLAVRVGKIETAAQYFQRGGGPLGEALVRTICREPEEQDKGKVRKDAPESTRGTLTEAVEELERLNGFECDWQSSVEAGRIILDLSGNRGLSDIAPLRGVRLASLDLSDTMVEDLSPLRGSQLDELSLQGTPTTDFASLRLLPLRQLTVGGTRFRTGVALDLKPLRGASLVSLRVQMARMADLRALKGMRLRALSLAYVRLEDAGLDALRGMPLEMLQLLQTNLDSLSPLKGMPLRCLDLQGVWGVTDLKPLTGLRQLDVLLLPRTVTEDALPDKMRRVKTIGIGRGAYEARRKWQASWDVLHEDIRKRSAKRWRARSR